jgi:hypothetical protein
MPVLHWARRDPRPRPTAPNGQELGTPDGSPRSVDVTPMSDEFTNPIQRDDFRLWKWNRKPALHYLWRLSRRSRSCPERLLLGHR